MKVKKGLNKKALSIDCDEISGMQASVYSEINADGLRFLKYDIMIGREGLTNISGDTYANMPSVTKTELQALGNQLGKGAACHVQDGIYKPLGVKVAIKVQTINAYDRGKRHQIMKDIKILLCNKIKAEQNGYACSFLVNLYGAYFEEGSIKVILQLMDAGSLDGILKIYKAKKVTPNIDEVILAKIAIQILCGLSYLHTNNQFHRDIKPANILLNSKGQVKITDFGIAKELDFAEQMSTTCVGTQIYMSPERVYGEAYDTKSDVWSFGIVMYELATGHFPFSDQVTCFELAQIMNEQFTLQLPSIYSKQFHDFLNKTLRIDLSKRASSTELLGHPWILQNISGRKSVQQWLLYVRDKVLKA